MGIIEEIETRAEGDKNTLEQMIVDEYDEAVKRKEILSCEMTDLEHKMIEIEAYWRK